MLIVANDQAGSAEADAIDAAVRVLAAAGTVALAHGGPPDELDRLLDRRDSPTVVVVGGDGSLHAMVAALHRRGELRQSPVGLIPLGTGNDFARGTGVPLDPVAAARLVLEWEPRALDLLIDDMGGVVVNAVHVGTGAEAAEAARPWKAPTISGGTASLHPGAVPDDGRVEVIVSRAHRPMARLDFALRLRTAGHLDRADVISARGCHVTVAGEPFLVNADGEVSGPVHSRSWRVHPAAWRFILPTRRARAGEDSRGDPAGAP